MECVSIGKMQVRGGENFRQQLLLLLFAHFPTSCRARRAMMRRLTMKRHRGASHFMGCTIFIPHLMHLVK